MGEVTDERVDLAEREGRRRVPLEVAPDEAVVSDLQLQRGGAGALDRRGAMLFDQPEDTQDTADPELAVAAMDRGAELADVGAGARGLREQRQRGGRGARRAIRGVDRVVPGRLAAVLSKQLARRGPTWRRLVRDPLRRPGLSGCPGPTPARSRGTRKGEHSPCASCLRSSRAATESLGHGRPLAATPAGSRASSSASGIREWTARQLQPCEGEFGGVAVDRVGWGQAHGVLPS